MLNSENVHEDGVYLLENGEDGLIYVGDAVDSATLEQLFGVTSLAALPSQVSLVNFFFIFLEASALSLHWTPRI
jgi:protein transport protein SEC24